MATTQLFTFKAVLAVFASFLFFLPLQKLHTRKRNKINVLSGVFLVWNAIISVQHSRLILTLHSFTQWTYYLYIDTRFKMNYDRSVFKIRGVYYNKVIYLMTNQSLSSTFKRNIFLTKISANASLILQILAQ